MKSTLLQDADAIWPLIERKVAALVSAATRGTGGAAAIGEHDIGGTYHKGTLRDDQAPQFLLVSGGRTLAGHLAVDDGITIDSVDISAHAGDPDAHHARATAGNGISVSGQQINLATPGTLAVSSSNNASGNHTHAISSSSNPGAAAAILATSAVGALTLSGTLQLLGADDSAQLHLRAATPGYDSYLYQDGSNLRLDVESLTSALLVSGGGIVTVTNRLATPLIVAAADLTINPAGDLTLNPGGGEIFIPGADTMRSEAWTSGVLGTGWGLQERGGAGRSHLDIRSIYCDELIATTFTADQVRVRSGSDWLGEALAIAARDNSDNKVTIPNVGGGSVRVYVEDVPEITGQIFDSNEYVLIKTINRAAGLVIRETWGRVSSYSAETGGRQSYSWTTVSGSGNFALEPGTALTGFGVSGGSYIFRTVIEAGRGPVERFATWVTNPYTPANRTSRVEIGDIKNAAGDSTTRYGIAAGNNLALTPTTGFSGLTVDSVNGARFYNGSVEIYSGSDRDVWIASHGMYVRSDDHGIIAFSEDISGTSVAETTEVARLTTSTLTDNALIVTAWDDSPSGRDARILLEADGIGTGGYAYISLKAGDGADDIRLSADTVLINGGTAWHSANDGTDSGLHADLLDSYHASSFVLATNYEDGDVLTKIKNVDGASSGLDADLLDGYQGSAFGRLAVNNSWTETQHFSKNGGRAWYAYIDTSGVGYGPIIYTTGALSTSTNEDYMTFVHLSNDLMAIIVADGSAYRSLALQPYGGDVRVGTTGNTYSARLNVSGNIHCDGVVTAEDYFQVKQRSGAPSAASGWGRIYYDSGDDKLKYISSGGTVRTLSYT